MQNLIFYKNRSFIALLIFLAISLGLMFMNVKFPDFSLRSVFNVIIYPFQYGASAVGRFFFDSVTGLSRIRELENRLKEYETRIVQFQENTLLLNQIDRENKELRNILEIKARIPYTTRYARIIARDPNLTGDYMVIDKGLFDGLRVNMPVVAYDTNGALCVVGRISEVSLSGSKVKTITAYDSTIGISLKDSGYIGILKGKGSWAQNAIVDFIPVEAQATIGEEVLTSGESDIFPRGLLVGHIEGIGRSSSEEFFKKLLIRPEFKYLKSSDVFIIEWQAEKESQNASVENAQ